MAGSRGWNLQVTFNLQRRSDNGRINSSPVTSTNPIIRLQQGCTHHIRILGNILLLMFIQFNFKFMHVINRYILHP